MSHKIIRLWADILKKPLMVSDSYFNTAKNYFEGRNLESFEMISPSQVAAKNEDEEIIFEGNVGVIYIDGPMLYKKMDAEPLCGPQLVSYEAIHENWEAMCKAEEVDTIVMAIDSPGGQSYSVFEEARWMRQMADKWDKQVIAYVDGGMHSAALALGVIADEVIINPDAEVGSIGVRLALESDLKKRINEGHEIRFITFGEEKVPFDEDGSFKESFIEDAQEKVDDLGNQFVTHVAEFRNISEEQVRDTKARSFSSQKAVELGLADKVMEREEFFQHLAENSSKEKNEMNFKRKGVTSMSEDAKVIQLSQEDFDKLQSQLASMEEQNTKLIEAQARKELETKIKDYQFVEDSESLATDLTATESTDSVFAALDAAQERITSLESDLATANEQIKALKEGSDTDMFKKQSGKEEGEDGGQVKTMKNHVMAAIQAKTGQ